MIKDPAAPAPIPKFSGVSPIKTAVNTPDYRRCLNP